MRVVLTGASGQLGGYLISRLVEAGHEIEAWSGRTEGDLGGIPLRPVDLACGPGLIASLGASDPDVVIHAGAISAAENVRRDPEAAHAVNVEATRTIATWCERARRRLVFTSTDLVFDGSKPMNREGDPTHPRLAYGRSKREAEASVERLETGLVARLSLLFGPSRSGGSTYLDGMVASLRRGEPKSFFQDEYRSPLDLATAADLLVRLAEGDARGVIHVGGVERVSRFDLARRVAGALGLDVSLIRPNCQADVPSAEPRPVDVSLDTSRLCRLLEGLERPSIEAAARRLWSARPTSEVDRSGGIGLR